MTTAPITSPKKANPTGVGFCIPVVSDKWIAALLIATALLIRLPHFGDPAYMIDEQFYLLVGDRMLHGALPYVDIWDRKPIGLFLIYAAIRMLGGEGFWHIIVASFFAAATAFVIYRIGRPIAGHLGALDLGLALSALD